MACFIELEEIILKLVWKHTRYRVPKTILRKKKTKMEETFFFISDCTKKLQQSKQHGTDVKNTHINQ